MADDDKGAGTPSKNPTEVRLLRLIAVSGTGLFVMALVAVLWIGSLVLLPFFAAFLLMVGLAPVANWFRRRGMPPQLVAFVGTGVFVIFLLIGVVGFVLPATHWIAQAPQIGLKLEQRLETVRGAVKAIEDAGKRVEKAAKGKEDKSVVRVEIKQPGIMQQLLSTTPTILLQIALTVVLLFFMLATRDAFREQLIVTPDRWGTKIRVARVIRQIEQNCSSYIFSVSLLNMGLGAAVGVALFLLGMPEPVLWAIQSALLNFVPFIGPLLSVGIVGVVALALVDPLWMAILVPVVVLALHLIEAMVVRPNLFSFRFRLNPFVVFIHLIFWSWIWGPVGALMSVPLLIILKVLFDQIDVLEPIGSMLGRDTKAERQAEVAESLAEGAEDTDAARETKGSPARA